MHDENPAEAADSHVYVGQEDFGSCPEPYSNHRHFMHDQPGLRTTVIYRMHDEDPADAADSDIYVD